MDYCLEKFVGVLVYVIFLGVDVDVCMDDLWVWLIYGMKLYMDELENKGCWILVFCIVVGVVCFLFDDLCMQLFGVSDYFWIVYVYGIVFIDDIFVMLKVCCNEVKCFIILIDILYDNGIKLVVFVEVELIDFYVVDSGMEVFEFDCIVLCLIEMWLEVYFVGVCCEL